MIAVQDRSGPYHRVPGGRSADNRRAVGYVHDAGIKPQRAHAGERGFKSFFLLDRLFGGEDLPRCKMREGAFQAQVWTVPKPPRPGNDPVAVGVALDDGENFPASRAAARWIHVAADRAQVAGQRTQTYFRPHRASIKFYGFCHENRHFESTRYRHRKKLLTVQWRAASY